MDRDKQYSHISVNADGEEEIVIQAGIPRSPVRERFEAEQAADVFEEPVIEDEVDIEVDPAPIEETSAREANAPRYRETTQDDLDTVSPMSNTQKAVIVAAILLVVGFVLYYNFLR